MRTISCTPLPCQAGRRHCVIDTPGAAPWIGETVLGPERETSCTIIVNGTSHTVAAAPDTPLIYILRNDLALNGPKFGCGLGECGACMVLIDGRAARSCVVALAAAAGRDITTLEGLGNCRVQRAFIEAQAAQCGYCLNGMIITTKAFLAHNPHPTDAEIRSALQHNLCRCGAHIEILQAVRRAAEAA